IVFALAGTTLLAGCAQRHHTSSATTSPINGTDGSSDNGTETTAEKHVMGTTYFPDATPERVVHVTEQVFPAVVRLDVAQEIYSEGKRTLRRGIGSGVIIDKEGHVLTNYHVAGRAAEIYVTLANKERVPARLVGDDHWTDLAVVQMEMDVIARRKIDFNFAELGDSKRLAPCENVMAIGTPFGLARTVTLGVVSNTDRTFYPEQQTIDEYETGEFSNWIQMDTPISPGNSGGPLVDMYGKVVGINTLGIRMGQNLNFAIPIDTAKQVIKSILATATPDKKGFVDRSDLGIDFKPLQDLETFYDIDINKGALINSVDRGSAAAKAGVKTQDILLELNGKPINVRFPEEVSPARKLISDLPIGSDVQMTVRRGKETLHLTAQTQKLEGAVGDEKELKTWGMSVRDVTRRYANDEQLDDDTGVVITTMSPGYPAAKAELQSGDVIRSINQKPATDLDEFMKLYNDSVKNKEKTVYIEIQRNLGRRAAVLKVNY
ncbi:MAG TPA: trypsin-like peptidase domain-containing protein, partial [Tepidisphaeraceae bacterium]|nr:trypsin-like peptidase domain-containing protein [Tepidisphaeraceae bacterium]